MVKVRLVRIHDKTKLSKKTREAFNEVPKRNYVSQAALFRRPVAASHVASLKDLHVSWF